MTDKEVVFKGGVSELPKPEGNRPSGKMLEEDHEYQVFSNLMDTVFDLANDLCDKKRLTNNERKFLEAMDEYCALDEEGENNE